MALEQQPSSIFYYTYGIFKALMEKAEKEVLEEFKALGSDGTFDQRMLGLMEYRAKLAVSEHAWLLKETFRFLLEDKEDTNFTYEISETSRKYFACFVSSICSITFEEAEQYMSELENATWLQRHLQEVLAHNPGIVTTNPRLKFGKRLAWYAFVRATKPRVVIETGVDKGLGGLAICAALLLNRKEGANGRYYGIDLDPHSGYLFGGECRSVGEIVYGDSVQTLQRFTFGVDMLITDSDHTPGHELREYEAVAPRLSGNALIISDTAKEDVCLMEYAHKTGRSFLYAPEYSKDHWCQGGGVGVAYRPQSSPLRFQ